MSSSDSSSTVPVGANSASVNPEQQVRSTTEPVKFETYYVIPQIEQGDRAAAPPQMLEAGSLPSRESVATSSESRTSSDPFYHPKDANMWDARIGIVPKIHHFTKERRGFIFVIGLGIVALFVMATIGILIFHILPNLPTEPTPTDAATTPRRLEIPGEMREWNGFQYIYTTVERPWQDAQGECRLWGGELASIHSSEENDIVKSLHQGNCDEEKCLNGKCQPSIEIGFHHHDRCKQSVWIGLNDLGNEGNFVWTDATTSTDFKAWDENRGEPDNEGGNENCAAQSSSNGKWRDHDCRHTQRAICKRQKL